MEVLKSYFVFDGQSSIDFGLTIEQPTISKKAKRIINRITVPGGSGDYLDDTGTWDNVEISYRVWCADKRAVDRVQSRVDAIASWLDQGGYRVLSDSYDPDYFRLACCLDPLDPEISSRRYARQDITFTCQPFKYSWAGQTPLDFYINQNFTLINREKIEALPWVCIYGTGSATITLNGKSWTISNISGNVIMDSDAKSVVTEAGDPADSRKTGDGYPVLVPGENVLTVTGSGGYVDRVKIIPRWRRL